MTKLKVTDIHGVVHEFNQPVDISLKENGELLVFKLKDKSEFVRKELLAGFHSGWTFEWGVRDETPKQPEGKANGKPQA